jgi:hypothetical protein
MSEMIGSRDPPWGVLSPLHAAGGEYSRRAASAFGPSDGDCAEAAGVRACPPGTMSEMIGSRDAPWARSHRYTLVSGKTRREGIRARFQRRDCSGAAGARSVDRSVPDGQKERNDRQSRPTLGRAFTVHAGGRQYSARRHPRSVPATGIALERLALGSVDWGLPARQNERNGRQSRRTLGALPPLHAAGRQYSTRRHRHSVPATGIVLERLALGSVDRSVK